MLAARHPRASLRRRSAPPPRSSRFSATESKLFQLAIAIRVQKKLKMISEYKSKGFNILGLVMVMTEIPVPYTAFEWGEMIYALNLGTDKHYDRIFFTLNP